jgi:hypothetical protein
MFLKRQFWIKKLTEIPARVNDSIKVKLVSVAGICCCNGLLSKGNN